MKSHKPIIINRQGFCQQCPVCKEKFDVEFYQSKRIYNRTPILMNCGHTICHRCTQNQGKKIVIQGWLSEGIVDFKCPICNQNFYQPDMFTNINHQLISYCQDGKNKCKTCKKLFSINSLPCFKQSEYQLKSTAFNLSYESEKNRLVDKLQFDSSTQTKKQYNLVLTCLFCLKKQVDSSNIQKNYVFSQVFYYALKYGCNERRCQKYFDYNLGQTCDCFYDQLQEEQKRNLIPNVTIRYLQTTMTDDFRRLYKLFILQSEMRNYFKEYQIPIQNIILNILNQPKKRYSLRNSKQVEEPTTELVAYDFTKQLQSQAFINCKQKLEQDLCKFTSSFQQYFTESTLQVIKKEQSKEENKNLNIYQIFKKQNFLKQIRINETLLKILRVVERHIEPIQAALNNTRAWQFLIELEQIKEEPKNVLEKSLQIELQNFIIKSLTKLQILDVKLKCMFFLNCADYQKYIIKAAKFHQITKEKNKQQKQQKLLKQRKQIYRSKSI